MTKVVANESQLSMLAGAIKLELKDRNIILLKGDLASGKTTLTKSIVKSLGIEDSVTSPTFSIQQIYGDNRVFHYDTYNKNLEEFINLGLFEELEREGLHIIEWADEKFEKLLREYGFEYLPITIETLKDKREYYIGR